MNKTEIIAEVLVRLGADTTMAFYSDDMMSDWFLQALRWSARYKKWPFTEGKESTTYSSSTEEYAYPEKWRPDGIRLLQVGGKRLQKLNFYDYQKYREDNSDGTDKVFTDYYDRYFINPNIGLSGTITVWGQYEPYFDITDETGKTFFSNRADDGNEAVINRMISFAKEKEQKYQEHTLYLQKAQAILDGIWKDIQDEQAMYQAKDTNLWASFDAVNGTYRSSNEDLFY